MLEIIFHMFVAFILVAGVVYFSIFSWLKLQQPKNTSNYQPKAVQRKLKTTLARSH